MPICDYVLLMIYISIYYLNIIHILIQHINIYKSYTINVKAKTNDICLRRESRLGPGTSACPASGPVRSAVASRRAFSVAESETRQRGVSPLARRAMGFLDTSVKTEWCCARKGGVWGVPVVTPHRASCGASACAQRSHGGRTDGGLCAH